MSLWRLLFVTRADLHSEIGQIENKTPRTLKRNGRVVGLGIFLIFFINFFVLSLSMTITANIQKQGIKGTDQSEGSILARKLL